ncbi:hypothetical protein MTO96_032278 [Rhipicephalus appendiculatus]
MRVIDGGGIECRKLRNGELFVKNAVVPATSQLLQIISTRGGYLYGFSQRRRSSCERCRDSKPISAHVLVTFAIPGTNPRRRWLVQLARPGRLLHRFNPKRVRPLRPQSPYRYHRYCRYRFQLKPPACRRKWPVTTQQGMSDARARRFPELHTQMTVDDVASYIGQLPGCARYAETFRRHQIDGKALLLLHEHHLTLKMNIALGPALKIVAAINWLRLQEKKKSARPAK